MSSQQLPVTQLNFTAMKSLMDEGRELRKRLEDEKSLLRQNILKLQDHISLAGNLYKNGRINEKLYTELSKISNDFVDYNLQPNLKIVNQKLESQNVNESERAKQIQYDVQELQLKIMELSQQKAALVLEEQKICAKESTFFEEASALRQQCNSLVQELETSETLVSELTGELDFWRESNEKDNSVLQDSIKDLQSLHFTKDAEYLKLMQELADIYTKLDEASQKLRIQSN